MAAACVRHGWYAAKATPPHMQLKRTSSYLASLTPACPACLPAWYEPQVVAQAGLLLLEPGGPGPAPAPQQLFYCRPSASLAALLPALGRAADAVRDQAESGLGRPEHARKWMRARQQVRQCMVLVARDEPRVWQCLDCLVVTSGGECPCVRFLASMPCWLYRAGVV
jgi:hypothetical protein